MRKIQENRYILKAVRSGVTRVLSGRSDLRPQQLLTALVGEALDTADSYNPFAAVDDSLQGSPRDLAYWHRTQRQVAGVQPLTSATRQDILQFSAIPIYFHRRGSSVQGLLREFPCQSEMERTLERTFDLGFLQVRMAPHPVSVIELSRLSAREVRNLSLDMLTQGDSPLLRPPALDMQDTDPAEQAMVWPMVWRLSAEDHIRRARGFGSPSMRNPEVARYKHRVDALLERDLQLMLKGQFAVDIRMPVVYPDLFTVVRHMSLGKFFSNAARIREGLPTAIHWRRVSDRVEIKVLAVNKGYACLEVFDTLAFEGQAAPLDDTLVEFCARYAFEPVQGTFAP